MEILNRKARFNYFIIDEMEAGIELKGTEIKSIRNGKCSIEDTYARIKNGEVYLINMYIAKYEEGNILIMMKEEKESYFFIKVKLLS